MNGLCLSHGSSFRLWSHQLRPGLTFRVLRTARLGHRPRRAMSSDSDEADPISRISLVETEEEFGVSGGEEEQEVCSYRLREGKGEVRVREVRVREVRKEGLSFKVWPAAWAMCEYLEACFGEAGMRKGERWRVAGAEAEAEAERVKDGAAMKVLELGAGTGMVGMVCAAMGAHCTITDLPHVTPNLRHNAALNPAFAANISVSTLRWGHSPDMDAILSENPPFDLILASDVVYHRHLFSPLLSTLSSLLLLHHSLCPPPIVLLAHLRRWKHDSLFFKKASKLFHVSVVHRAQPSSSDNNVNANTSASRTGVTIYRLSCKQPLSCS